MLPNELERLVYRAQPGDQIVYHTGFLLVDRDAKRSKFSLNEINEIIACAEEALRLAGWKKQRDLSGFDYILKLPVYVELTQRRIGPDRYEYIAMRTKKEFNAADLTPEKIVVRAPEPALNELYFRSEPTNPFMLWPGQPTPEVPASNGESKCS